MAEGVLGNAVEVDGANEAAAAEECVTLRGVDERLDALRSRTERDSAVLPEGDGDVAHVLTDLWRHVDAAAALVLVHQLLDRLPRDRQETGSGERQGGGGRMVVSEEIR